MPFKRNWDSTCPRVYDKWETEGVSWVIQDLPLEDDEEALRMLVENFIPDEKLIIVSKEMGLPLDDLGISGWSDFWRDCIKKRTSLGCYATKDGKRTLAAMNCCIVKCVDDVDSTKVEDACSQNVVAAMHIAEAKAEYFKYLETDEVLYAVGLVVRRDYRGAKLGARVLAAREPLCRVLGIKGTATVFTGVASQKCAERAGFCTVVTISFQELADAGLVYPKDSNSFIKVMAKSYA